MPHREVFRWELTEDQLRRSESHFQLAFDQAPIGMALVGLDGSWLKVNRAVSRMLGYTQAELLKTDFQHLTHPEDLKADLELVKQLVEGKIEAYQMEKRYFHKSGAVVYAMLSVSVVTDADDAPIYFVSQIENVTERKEAERALRAVELRYSSMFNNMLDGFAYCRLVVEKGVPVDFIYLEVNKNFEAMTGLKKVTGRRVSEVIPEIKKKHEMLERYQRVVTTGKPERYESYVETLKRWFSVSIYSFEKEHFAVVFNNITEEKQQHTERERLIGKLQTALAQVKTLSGMIPICAWCKSVRNDKGYWSTVENYVRSHSSATFSHGICPKCNVKFLADMDKKFGKKEPKKRGGK